MPPRRKALPAKTNVKTEERVVDTKKRKRGAPVVPVAEPAAGPSPKSRKRAKADEDQVNGAPKPPSKRRAAKVDTDDEKDVPKNLPNSTVEASTTESPAKKGRKPKTVAETKEDPEACESHNEDEPTKPKRKRKTQEEKDAEAMPLAARSLGLKMYVGAHTSIAKGVENAITNSVHIGGNAFACFLKSQRKWDNPALKDENRDAFRQGLVEHKFDGMKHIVPHGSYLVNLATEDKDQAKKGYDAFLDDLRRCEALGIRYYNFHPGGAGQSPLNEAISRLANNLNRALSETTTVVPLLENMAGHGTLIGGRFSDLRDVIAQIKPEYKSRIGVCIDTCHTFAAGYDLRTPAAFEKTMRDFDETVGIGYLKALHLNDSKMPLDSHRDLHQNIGLGFLGLRAFHNVMNEPRFQGLPLILETPSEKPDPSDPKGKKTIEDKSIWAAEIKLLESLIGMDAEGEEFKKLERDLSERGRAEREKMQAQYDKTSKEKAKKAARELEKGQKSLKDMFAPKGAAKKGKSKAAAESEASELSELSESD